MRLRIILCFFGLLILSQSSTTFFESQSLTRKFAKVLVSAVSNILDDFLDNILCFTTQGQGLFFLIFPKLSYLKIQAILLLFSFKEFLLGMLHVMQSQPIMHRFWICQRKLSSLHQHDVRSFEQSYWTT